MKMRRATSPVSGEATPFASLLATTHTFSRPVQECHERVIEAIARNTMLEAAIAPMEEVARARAAEDNARTTADAHRGWLDAAKRTLDERLRPEHRGSLLHAVMGLAGFAALFGAEYYLSLKTLAYVMGADIRTSSATMIALVPPVALTAIEVLLLELIESPWKRALAESRNTLVLGLIRSLLFIALLAGNVAMVMAVSDAREIAMLLIGGLKSSTAPASALIIDRAAIRDVVRWVSLMSALDGGLLLLVSWPECRKIIRRSIALLSVHRGGEVQLKLDHSVRDATAVREIREAAAAAAREIAATTAEVERNALRVALENALRRERPRQSSLDTVNRVLSGDLAAREVLASMYMN